MEDIKTKNGWGGSRIGAGRKKSVLGKYYGFNSTPEVETILEEIGSGKTAYINAAIIAYHNMISGK